LVTWGADFCSPVGVEDSGLVHVVYELKIGFSCAAPSHCYKLSSAEINDVEVGADAIRHPDMEHS